MNYPAKLSRSTLDPSLFSAAEFSEMISLGAFQDMRAELVNGKIERMAPAYGDHGESNFSVANRINLALAGAANIAIDLAVEIGELTIRGPDIAVSLEPFNKSAPTPAGNLLLAIEIADTTLARDLGDKAKDYARAGIATYWVIDLNGRVVHVMTDPTESGYTNRSVIRFGEPLTIPSSDATITI